MLGHVDRIPVTGKTPQAQHGDWWSLVFSLFLSFLYCALLAFVGALGAETVTVRVVWIAAWAVYWLVFAVLQVWWWRKGYGNFWRPVYAWSLFAFICLSLFFLPVLLVPRFRRWLFRG